MGFDKIVGKAKDLASDPRVKNALNDDRAEQISDSVLDKAASAADALTGGKHADTIRKARDAADRSIGNEGRRADDEGRPRGPREDR